MTSIRNVRLSTTQREAAALSSVREQKASQERKKFKASSLQTSSGIVLSNQPAHWFKFEVKHQNDGNFFIGLDIRGHHMKKLAKGPPPCFRAL